MISDRYIDEMIADGETKPAEINDESIQKITDTLALKIDNKIESAIKKIDEKLQQVQNIGQQPQNDDPETNENNAPESNENNNESEDNKNE